MKAPPIPEEAPLPRFAALGETTKRNGVELTFNGLQWVPVFNPRNYPHRFFPDGTERPR